MPDVLEPPQSIGQMAEERACEFLLKQGLKLLARNYRCYLGEIDLIMEDQKNIVFVEVRLRNHSTFGDAIESINRPKQQKLLKSAIHYLQKNKLLDKVNCRFDIIGFSQGQIDWIKDAFDYE